MHFSAAQIMSRSSSLTVTGRADHSAHTLLSDGVNLTASNAVFRSLGRQMYSGAINHADRAVMRALRDWFAE
ncbi:hypothetical protein ACFVU0_18210 [Streptomyces sp. NPDC058122]|uniref:hypothetical protein n=1 Tax=Streptomyces sp. NPDC058122 TaxID=3346349 RepID=UPI0036E1ABC0